MPILNDKISLTGNSYEQSVPRIARRPQIAPTVLFLDGLTGSGKTMMGPILGSFKRVQLGRLEHVYEYLCVLDDLGKIDSPAAAFMISMYADLSLYNTMIARETNFRWNDLSSVFRNPNALEYIKRLFLPDGNGVVERIGKENPILQIISHQALGVMNLAFRAFEARLRLVEMVRHPLYLLEHWYSYIDRHGVDPRDLTIWIDYQGKRLPWFAQGWEAKYVDSSTMDRVIYSIGWLTQKREKTFLGLDDSQRNQILTIPFERFVLNPHPFIKRIAEFLNTQPTLTTQKMLKKQRCPRTQVAAGPAKEIYKRYGWRKPDPRSNDVEELHDKRKWIEPFATKEGMKALDELCGEYERKHGRWFA